VNQVKIQDYLYTAPVTGVLTSSLPQRREIRRFALRDVGSPGNLAHCEQ
jgi:hypothetical protein